VSINGEPDNLLIEEEERQTDFSSSDEYHDSSLHPLPQAGKPHVLTWTEDSKFSRTFDAIREVDTSFQDEPLVAVPEPLKPIVVGHIKGRLYKKGFFHPWGTTSRFSKPHWDIHKNNVGIEQFFLSAVAEEWFAFVGIFIFFLLVQYHLYEWPSKHNYHGVALLIWFFIAGICNMIVFWRWGPEIAEDWLNGYMLELVFSIENIFVFHIVVRAFRVPRRHAQKALMIVVVTQIMFEMVFFMGLAWAIRASNVLPYILGVWLIYVGYQAGYEDTHLDMNFKETWVYSWTEWLLGPRLVARYRKNDTRLICYGEKGVQFTLLFVATVALVVVDFLLEVDVVLTKIEELDGNNYLAFTSSAAAAFAVPELFFVCRDLFARYYLLKFGICFVLVFFGIQLLAHELVAIPTIFQIIITIVVMIICVVLSMMLPAKRSDLDADESEFEAVSSGNESEVTSGR